MLRVTVALSLISAVFSCAPSAADGGPDAAATRPEVAACESYIAFQERCLGRLPKDEQERRGPVFEREKRAFRSVARNLVTDSARASLGKACDEAMSAARAACPPEP